MINEQKIIHTQKKIKKNGGKKWKIVMNIIRKLKPKLTLKAHLLLKCIIKCNFFILFCHDHQNY